MENIIINGKVLAYVASLNEVSEDSRRAIFLTPDSCLLQVGFFQQIEGDEIQGHYHNHISRNIPYTTEVIILLEGEMNARFWPIENPELAEERQFGKGTVLYISDGAHSFSFPKNCRFMEIKQGPYLNERDKTRLETL